MDQPLTDSARRRAVRQYLENLALSGVEQMPFAGQIAASRCATPAVRNVGEHVVRPDSPGCSPTSDVDPIPPPAANSPSQANRKLTELHVLAEEVCACTRCPQLVQSRSRTVFGVGDPDARLCFFGEAPGADEDRIGEPFVGRAGQLLDRIIHACTLQRNEVYILNTIKCRPEGNRTPELDEVENCRPFFERQLEIIRPEFICCLGLVAARALLNTKLSLGRLRGQFHTWRFAKVVVTYHPAYLLRNPDAKRHTWEDMQMLMRAMGIKLGD